MGNGRFARTRRHSLKALGFLASPLLTVIIPLSLIPVVTGTFGPSGWTAYAVGQSLGLGAAVLVELGWGLNGPREVALADHLQRKRLLALASSSKLVMFFVAAPLVGMLGLVIPSPDRLAAATIALGYASLGLSHPWFFIGQGKPWTMICADVLPRICFTLIAIRSTYLGFGLAFIGLALLAGHFTNLLVAHSIARVSIRQIHSVRCQVPSVLRAQRLAVSGRLVSSVYISLPIAFVAVFNPAAVATFAAVERLARLTLGGLQGFTNFMQPWFAKAHDERFDPRLPHNSSQHVTLLFRLHMLLGIGSALAFGILGPCIAPLVFQGAIRPERDLFWLAGLVIMATCLSRATGLVLVSMERVGAIALSACVGAAVGTMLVPLLSLRFGAVGAISALCAVETSVLFVQLVIIKRRIQQAALVSRERSKIRGRDCFEQ